MKVILLCFDTKKSDNFEKSQLITGRSANDMVVALMEFHTDFLTGIQIEIFEEFNKISAFIRWILSSLSNNHKLCVYLFPRKILPCAPYSMVIHSTIKDIRYMPCALIPYCALIR